MNHSYHSIHFLTDYPDAVLHIPDTGYGFHQIYSPALFFAAANGTAQNHNIHFHLYTDVAGIYPVIISEAVANVFFDPVC